ncbi:MAG: PaaI family thioesterase [Acidimicrobiales bacterium]
MITPADGPVSAARLAEELGEALPVAGSVPEEAFTLVDRVRELVTAVVMTDVGPDERAAAAGRVAEITETLRARERAEPLFLVRHSDGRVESMVQAGSGRLNPQAPPLEWMVRPTEPPPGADPVSVEVRARCTFTVSHGGSPGRVYGGVLALVLDEVLGVAARAAGVGGMTVALSLSLKGATPVDVPVEIVGRATGWEGRKTFASGEVRAGGVVSAEASGIYVRERRHA